MPNVKDLEKSCRTAVQTCAGYNLRRTARVVTQLFDGAFAPTGLRSTQVAVLQMVVLKQSPSVRQLAKEMAMDPSTLTRNLQPLVREGLVELAPAERGRAKQARLTPKGREKLDEVTARWERAQAEFVRRFGAKNWNQLRADLRDVADVIGEAIRKRKPSLIDDD